jgi:putative selenate reductase
MSDIMRPLPFEQLLERIFEEYRAQRSVFGLHEDSWYRKTDNRTVDLLGTPCETALGPAAGPHTQLAQNIVASYLTGSRFIELKTVQILDELEIEKPCIDAGDEGFNTEWSTELTLQQSWEEYAKAWILLHLVEDLWDLRVSDHPRSFVFTMSVGYDLAGIKTDRMQQFIDRMIDSGNEPLFRQWLDDLQAAVPALLHGTGLEDRAETLVDLGDRIGSRICSSVTLSTMHGCPPKEIESICRYLLTEKKIDTLVKLNPTLIGYETVREILDRLGYGYVTLDREGFDHDLKYESALELITRLLATAKDHERRFGVKLTNTLATLNENGEGSAVAPADVAAAAPTAAPAAAPATAAKAGDHGSRDGHTGTVRLPGDQMYMSGRALFPLSITLAARLSAHFHGQLPISYSGGITAHNVAAVFRTGIRPITACTVFLKPGGYARQVQLARAVDEVECWDYPRIDVDAVTRLAESALSDRTLHKNFRGDDQVAVSGDLPFFDCYRAPCVCACPIGQNVPEYIRLVGEQRYAEALELIYEKNALPSITGHICDHQCQHACSRLDYEGCLNIREIKKIAVQQGTVGYNQRRPEPHGPSRPDRRCAVIGAGPTGLSAAYFLVRSGFPVTIFEREQNAGGVVRNVIPAFRLPVEAIEQDIDQIARLGVKFEFGVDPALNARVLRDRGYGPIVLGIGAEVDNELPIEGDRSRVIRSLDFLWGYRGNAREQNLGTKVVVVGGGNTAMDAARAAITLPEVQTVTVLYRRSEAEMPADREEYENAREDGVVFQFLRNPERIEADGTVTVRVMELGPPDDSGRRRPMPTDRTETLAADTMIAAIGERVDTQMLSRFGVPLDNDQQPVVDPETLETSLADVYLAGDAFTGPSTVVQCIAAGRRAAEAILRNETAHTGREESPVETGCAGKPELSSTPDLQDRLTQLRSRKATILDKPDALRYRDHREFSHTEYARCLECSYVCNRCEEVCPNRANISVPVIGEHLFSDPFQIVHIDAYCNECGNCGHFCPWTGKLPYRDKPTIFSSSEDFEDSTSDGWFVPEATGGNRLVCTRLAGSVSELSLSPEGRLQPAVGPTGGTGATGTAGSTGTADITQARFNRLFEILYRDRPGLFREVR